MKYFLYAFSFLLISSAPAYSLGIPYALQMWVTPKIQGEAIRVIDGDTIEVLQNKTRVRVRLLNIDAPEKKQDYGRWSTDTMKSLVAGKTVTVTYFQRDHYGRILGQVYAPDGMNINQFMVRAGAAWVYEQYNTDPVLPIQHN